MISRGEFRRILFVIPSLRYGGAEAFLLRLTSELNVNYIVTVIVIGKMEGLASKFEESSINVVYLNLPRRRQFLQAIIKMRRHIRLFQPDAIQSFLYYADFIATLSAFPLKSSRLTWSFRGSSLPKGNTKAKNLAIKVNVILSYLLPVKIISCSKQVSDFHERIGFSNKRTTIIPNFLSDWVYEKSKANSILLKCDKPENLRIGLAARFDPGKGHLALVEACSSLVKSKEGLKTVTLCFAGKGCEINGRLEEEVHSAKYSHPELKFEFSGLIESNMKSWYESLDLYVMPSSGLEGFPNSLSEAVTLGIPAIATNYGSALDFVGPKRLIQDPSPQTIHDSIVGILNEPLAQRILLTLERKNFMLKSFSKDEVITAYLNTWCI